MSDDLALAEANAGSIFSARDFIPGILVAPLKTWIEVVCIILMSAVWFLVGRYTITPGDAAPLNGRCEDGQWKFTK